MDTPPVPTTTAKQRTEPFAVISLIASVLAPCTGISALAGIIFGHLAKRRIARSNGQLGGDGIALAGLILSYGTIFMIAASMVIVIPAIGRNKVRLHQRQELSQLKQIMMAVYLYTDQHSDHLPSDLGVLMDQGILTDGSLFVSPGGDTLSPASGDDIRSGQCDFQYIAWTQRLSEFQDPATTIVVYSKLGNFHDWAGIAFLDGHVTDIRGQTVEQAARLEGWELREQP